MDGENNGSKPYVLMDFFGGKTTNHYVWFNTQKMQKQPALVGGFNPSEKY